MVNPLDGIDTKLRRGFEHLGELDRLATAFVTSDPRPFELRLTEDRGTGWVVATFHILREAPSLLGVVAGEAVGQFRSALDHLMTQLLLLDAKRDAKLNFPIYAERAAFVRRARSGRSPREALRRVLRPEHFALIERMQPFNDTSSERRDTHPLRVLSRFSNVDKHQVVHAAYVGIADMSLVRNPSVHPPEWLYRPTGVGADCVIEDGTRLLRFRPKGDADLTKVTLVVRPEIGFGPVPTYCLDVKSLRLVASTVQMYIDEIRALTPEFGP